MHHASLITDLDNILGDVIDELEQLFAAPIYLGNRVAKSGRHLAVHVVENERGKVDARVHRRAQFVRNTGQESALDLGGLHHFVGIPSTVGGALWQNLHFLAPAPERARTVFIEEVLESADLLTEEGERRTVDVDYFEFGYDDSVLHHRDDIVLSATFRLEPTPVDDLRRIMREKLEWRDERHPDRWLYPCAGSIFQKIDVPFSIFAALLALLAPAVAHADPADIEAPAILGTNRVVATLVAILPDDAESLDLTVAACRTRLAGTSGGVSRVGTGAGAKIVVRIAAPSSYVLRRQLLPVIALFLGDRSLPKVWSL